MKNKKLIFGLIIFGLGLIGVLSLLSMEVPIPPEAEEILKEFSLIEKKLLTMINPIFMLTISTIIGTVLFNKVHLSSPILEKVVGLKEEANYFDILKFGVIGGLVSGILLSLIFHFFNPILPNEFLELKDSIKPTLASRFLYGGLTEEILMRFGLMTLLIWLASKLFKGTKPIIYRIGIAITAIIFALGHFPIVYQSVGNPSIGLLTYILIGNTIGGLLYGWLYWKKGLESAFLAHIFTHFIMVIAERMFN